MDKPDTHLAETRPLLEAPARAAARPRRPPPLRVVTKGWLTLEETTADIEDLKRESASQPG